MFTKDVLLLKYGEIALRGNNRFIYENLIIDDVKSRTPQLRTVKEQGRILLECREGDVDYDSVIPKLSTILGVVGLCPCMMIREHDIEYLKEAALVYVNKHGLDIPQTFKVVSKRADKRYPLTSNEISANIGEYLLDNTQHLRVDVKNPDITIYVELRNQAYIYSSIIKGVGGLPRGSSGKGTLLLSGGFDSPVAGFLMAKRGVMLSCLYFHSPPYTSERAKDKVIDLARRLSVYAKSRLFIVPFTEIQLYLKENVPPEKLTIFLKRAMIRLSDRWARSNDNQCLITGDSIGQVASQTLKSIEAVNTAATLPILRPLAGMDKQEIMDLARKIETYDISAQPYEDCCTIFVAKHPETRPSPVIIESLESKLDKLSQLIDSAIVNMSEAELNLGGVQ